MSKRNTQHRRRSIIEHVQRHGEVSVEVLANEYGTSEVTIRKDLNELESTGLLMRRYGGAVAMPQELLNDTAEVSGYSSEKRAIAKAAAQIINDHNRIIIDSGTTTQALLPELSQKQGLVVMTNSLSVANALRELENEPTLLMTGGTWDARSESFQGQLAEKVLRAYNFDQLFLGADGLDADRGTTTFNELYQLSQVMAEISREVIVLAESAKLERKVHNLELSWDQVDTLITDNKIEKHHLTQIQQQGVNVVCAQ